MKICNRPEREFQQCGGARIEDEKEDIIDPDELPDGNYIVDINNVYLTDINGNMVVKI